jgi:transcriptional regulator with XRE-family HTH domain
MSAYGDAVRVARVKAGVSLREAAKALGVSAPYLSDVERGQRAPLAPDKSAKLEKLVRARRGSLAVLADEERARTLAEQLVGRFGRERALEAVYQASIRSILGPEAKV